MKAGGAGDQDAGRMGVGLGAGGVADPALPNGTSLQNPAGRIGGERGRFQYLTSRSKIYFFLVLTKFDYYR